MDQFMTYLIRGFLEFCSFERAIAQVTHQIGNHLADAFSLRGKRLKDVLRDVFLIKGHIQLRPNFASRPFGDRKELAKLTSSTSFESFGYIRHHRHTRVAYLVFQTKVTSERTFPCNLVNLSS